ncbi:hypothetical protein [Nocardia brasiliensis]|uniref:hypothetical protein n=1 Tax=Nocardia brasiliensis TaxID=37326 RepID=UPI00366E4C71
MNIELDPPVGIPPVLIGMSREEAFRALGVWGSPELLTGPTDRLRVRDAELNVDIFVHLESADEVTAIEIWRPEDPSADIVVEFHELDVFRTPAREVLAELRSQGVRIDDSDRYYPNCPELTLGFNLEGDGSAGLDEEGLSIYFESALVAGPGYY